MSYVKNVRVHSFRSAVTGKEAHPFAWISINHLKWLKHFSARFYFITFIVFLLLFFFLYHQNNTNLQAKMFTYSWDIFQIPVWEMVRRQLFQRRGLLKNNLGGLLDSSSACRVQYETTTINLLPKPDRTKAKKYYPSRKTDTNALVLKWENVLHFW